MLRLEEIKEARLPGKSSKTYYVFWNERNVALLQTWLFSSCATWGISGMSLLLLEEQKVHGTLEKVLNALCSAPDMDWYPKEIYFQVSDSQIMHYGPIPESTNIRKIDVFNNKSHGPNKVHLYRYSLQGDFQS